MSLHLTPAGDTGRHETHLLCPCLPAVTVGTRPDGTYGLLVEHREFPTEPPQPRGVGMLNAAHPQPPKPSPAAGPETVEGQW